MARNARVECDHDLESGGFADRGPSPMRAFEARTAEGIPLSPREPRPWGIGDSSEWASRGRRSQAVLAATLSPRGDERHRTGGEPGSRLLAKVEAHAYHRLERTLTPLDLLDWRGRPIGRHNLETGEK